MAQWLSLNLKENSMANEAKLIANTLFSETKDLEDARHIASVIVKRTERPERFGSTPTEVVLQPHQFSGVGTPEWFKADTQSFKTDKEKNLYKSYLQIGYQVANKTFEPIVDADHYFNPKLVVPGWAKKMKRQAQNNYHSYYKE